MVQAKEAASIAARYFEEIAGERVRLSIEEIELSDDGYWMITLGISDPYGIGALGTKPHSYKLFKIEADSGEVRSMKIREIN